MVNPYRMFCLPLSGFSQSLGVTRQSRKMCTKLSFDILLKEKNKLRTKELLHRAGPVRTLKEMPLKPDHSYAAVLVPLCVVRGEPSLLFTLRSTRLTKHRGQVSFPGGNMDKTDPTVVFTALRETEEELGIHPNQVEIWGQMKPLPGSSGHKFVYPVVASISGNDGEDLELSSLTPSPEEVAQVFTVPISHLANYAYQGVTRFRVTSGQDYTLPVFLGAQHRIWGLTAVMTHQLLTVLAPGLYKFKIVHKKSMHRNQANTTVTHSVTR